MWCQKCARGGVLRRQNPAGVHLGWARASAATGWNEHLAGLLVDGGLVAEEAPPLATLLIAATEGAVVPSRTARDRAPFASVAASLTRQVDDVMRR